MATVRSSNFETLRMLAMAGIVMHHYAGNTPWEWNRECENYYWFNEYVLNCMATTGKIGVDVFLLMTGFFLNGKPLKATSVVRTWFQTVNWSYLVFIPAYYLTEIQDYQYKRVMSPIINHGYWFVASYVAMAFCSGWVAAIAKAATPTQYLTGLFALFVVMTMLKWPMEISYCNVLWFVFVMAMGAFLRRYQADLRAIRTRTLLTLLGVICLINYGSVYVFTFHEVKWAIDHHGFNALTRDNWSIVCLVYGVLLVLLVQRWDYHSAIINRLAACSLGVYLLHENMFISPRIFKEWVGAAVHRDSPFLPIIALFHVAGIYLVCSGFEYLRQFLFGWLEERVSKFVGSRLDSLSEYINNSFAFEGDEKNPNTFILP